MSVIVIRGFDPDKVNMKTLYYYLKPIINGTFRTWKMVDVQDYKICFVKLSKELDPKKVIRDIELAYKPPHMKIYAYMPGKAMAINYNITKNKNVSLKNIKKFAIKTFFELQKELQIKYNKLFITNMTDGHKLLDAVSKIIIDRLKRTIASNINCGSTKDQLSRMYRSNHPHNTDLALLQTAYNQIRDRHGLPHTTLVEKDLIYIAKEPNPKTYPFNKVMKTAMRFTRDITEKVETYIQSIPNDDMDNIPNLTKEEVVRVTVRRELKNLAPYLSLMVPQIVNKQWTLHNEERCQISVYGEPYIPSEIKVKNFLKMFDIKHYNKSPTIFNTALFTVLERDLPELLKMKCCYIDTAKLTFSLVPIHLHMQSTDITERLLHFLHAMNTSRRI